MSTTINATRYNRPIRFDASEAQRAFNDWNFNCGPGALCAAFDLSPEEIRSHLGNFEQRGYLDPDLMRDVLMSLAAAYHWNSFEGTPPANDPRMWPDFGLVRVQWDGPWCGPIQPASSRLRHSHWVAHRLNPEKGNQVFDVNATCVGGWIDREEWGSHLVPWLLKQCEPDASGNWWVTHSVSL